MFMWASVQFIGGESSLNTCKIFWKFLRNFKPVRLLIDLYIKELHILSYLKLMSNFLDSVLGFDRIW